MLLVAACAVAGCDLSSADPGSGIDGGPTVVNMNPAPTGIPVDRTLHDNLFPIARGGHANAQCDDCHGDSDTFTQFACYGSCHDHDRDPMDALHKYIPGYNYASSDCLNCHMGDGSGTIDRTKHDPYFHIQSSTLHGFLDCRSCHPVQADHSMFTCTTCHDHSQALMDPAHMKPMMVVTGYMFTDEACLCCHPKGDPP